MMHQIKILIRRSREVSHRRFHLLIYPHLRQLHFPCHLPVLPHRTVAAILVVCYIQEYLMLIALTKHRHSTQLTHYQQRHPMVTMEIMVICRGLLRQTTSNILIMQRLQLYPVHLSRIIPTTLIRRQLWLRLPRRIMDI